MPIPCSRLSGRLTRWILLALLLIPFAGCGDGSDEVQSPPLGNSPTWQLIWSDEFDDMAGTGVDRDKWIYDIGTGYPGGPPKWGTGETEVMTDDVANVYHDGEGHLGIKPLRGEDFEWTSGRIETKRSDFEAPAGGALALEASIKQPEVSGAAAAGYWPAFWSLGAAFRGNYNNWPGIGEIDILEDINGRSSEFGTLHCGTIGDPNPCNEFSGLGSGEIPCPGCQKSFHTYRAEVDFGVKPEEIRWYVDSEKFFTLHSDRVDETTWRNATHHGFFLILNVAIGGGFPEAFGGGPTANTVSGIPMLVDYVRVYVRQPSTTAETPTPSPITS